MARILAIRSHRRAKGIIEAQTSQAGAALEGESATGKKRNVQGAIEKHIELAAEHLAAQLGPAEVFREKCRSQIHQTMRGVIGPCVRGWGMR